MLVRAARLPDVPQLLASSAWTQDVDAAAGVLAFDIKRAQIVGDAVLRFYSGATGDALFHFTVHSAFLLAEGGRPDEHRRFARLVQVRCSLIRFVLFLSRFVFLCAAVCCGCGVFVLVVASGHLLSSGRSLRGACVAREAPSAHVYPHGRPLTFVCALIYLRPCAQSVDIDVGKKLPSAAMFDAPGFAVKLELELDADADDAECVGKKEEVAEGKEGEAAEERPPPPPLLTGIMECPDWRGAWQERYIVLSAGRLRCFTHRSAVLPLFSLDVAREFTSAADGFDECRFNVLVPRRRGPSVVSPSAADRAQVRSSHSLLFTRALSFFFLFLFAHILSFFAFVLLMRSRMRFKCDRSSSSASGSRQSHVSESRSAALSGDR